MVTLLTGHNDLAYFSSLVNNSENPSGCSFCNESDETFFHWATSCPALYLSRTKFLEPEVPNSNMTWSLADLLEFSRLETLNNIIECIE